MLFILPPPQTKPHKHPYQLKPHSYISTGVLVDFHMIHYIYTNYMGRSGFYLESNWKSCCNIYDRYCTSWSELPSPMCSLKYLCVQLYTVLESSPFKKFVSLLLQSSSCLKRLPCHCTLILLHGPADHNFHKHEGFRKYDQKK